MRPRCMLDLILDSLLIGTVVRTRLQLLIELVVMPLQSNRRRSIRLSCCNALSVELVD
jgi:hypothetical protein